MKQTQTYKLGIFESGDFLSPTFDLRRFVTLDYHLNTYVGILGNGIISGWNVESAGGLIARITPGAGFIAGLYAESPYAMDPSTKEPLRKSVATNLGYAITEEMISWTGKSGTWTGSFFNEGGSPDTDALVFQQLGPDGEDKNYDGIIDGILAPKYVPAPTSHLTNPYVKSYAPIDNQLLLEDNSDTYIFAERISEDPTSTFVRFVANTTYALISRRVLVAKVVTRDGEISQVDESMSFRISGTTGKIAELGRELVKIHNHGGNALTDPPKIKLKTDIRKCIPSNKNVNNEVTYSILPSKTTGMAANHKHDFEADYSGNGYTISVLGDYEFHFHKIENWKTVKTQLNHGSITAADHEHSLPEENSVISEGGRFRVYVNGIERDLKDYTINARAKTITFQPGKVNYSLPVYKSSFEIRGAPEPEPKRLYEYELETPSVRNFVMGMIIDFYRKYREEIEGYGVKEVLNTITVGSTEYGDGKEEDVEITKLEKEWLFWYLRSPFEFEFFEDGRSVERNEQGKYCFQDYIPISEPITGTGVGGAGDSALVTPVEQIQSSLVEKSSINTRGYEDVEPMSKMAATVLKKKGDRFVLLPNAAKFVAIELVTPGYADDVVVEILNDVEITGMLKAENIYFVRADKFMAGKFSPAKIPFLNHVGRIGEILATQRFATQSKNGIEFIPTTRTSRVSMGHAHRVYLDKKGNGVTIATTIGDQLAVWQYDKDGKAVKITHAHAISKNQLDPAINAGINQWNEASSGTSHSHDVDEVIYGTHTSVYSMSMDNDGNLLFADSNGIWILPVERAILTTIGPNEKKSINNLTDGSTTGIDAKEYYSYGKTVQESLENAIARYKNETGEDILVGETLTGQCSVAELTLSSVNKLYSFGGTPSISMMVVQYAKVDNLYEETIKEEEEIRSDEVVIRTLKTTETLGSILGDMSGILGDKSEALNTILGSVSGATEPPRYLVRRDLSNHIVWSSCWGNRQFSIASHDMIIQGSPDQQWKAISLPTSHDMIRSIAVSPPSESDPSNESVMLVATTGGLMISRNGGFSYSMLSAMKENCIDVAATKSAFAVSTNAGIYLVNHDGSYSKTLTSSNLRWLAVDKGDPNYVIYCLSLDRTIYRSTDGGSNWTTFVHLPDSIGEIGRLFACFGQVFIPIDKGLLNISSNNIVLPWSVRCSMWTNSGVMYFGGDGNVVSTVDGINFSTVMSFDGNTFPAFYVDNQRRLFGYAHTQNDGVVFLFPPESNEVVTAATIAERWIAPGGPWDENSNVDFMIDGKYVFSNRMGIDERGKSCDLFLIDPISGTLDFSTYSKLAANALAGDGVLYLSGSISPVYNRGVVISASSGKLYLSADSISGNVVRLSRPLLRPVEINSSIRILSSMTAMSAVVGNLYHSDFYHSDIGHDRVMSHQSLEDAFSQATVGLPMRMSETYIGNLSTLAIASKRGFYDIDSKFKNWKAFCLKYACNPWEENYYGNDFDIEATLAGSHSFFGKDSGSFNSQYIRCIAFGEGEFDGKVFAGTDAGLFMSETLRGMENPWIPVLDCPISDVFGILILGGKSIIVAGEGGVYKSDNGDITRWTPTAVFSGVANAATVLAFRWTGSQGPYWWNSWNGSINTLCEDLTNAIIVGGYNFLMISHDNGQSWFSIHTTLLGDRYTPSCILPMSDGTAIMAANGDATGKTSILYDLGAGDDWGEAATFNGIDDIVSKCYQNESGNVSLELKNGGDSFAPKDHALTGLTAIVGRTKRIIADNRDGVILLQGTDSISIGTGLRVSPLSVNSMLETKNKKVIVGTNLGLITDNGTYLNSDKNTAIINAMNKSATVEYIDIGGTVAASNITQNGEVSLTCQLERSVRTGDLAGKRLIFTSTISPSLSILSPGPGSTLSSSEISIITSTTMFEPGDTGFIKIQLDSRDPIYASSNMTKISGLTPGNHFLEVSLVGMDKMSGNFGAGTSRRLNFNTILSSNTPSISVSFPTSGQTIGSPSFDVTGQVLNFVAGVDGNLTYAVDNGASEAVITGKDGWFSIPISNLSNASHSVRLSLVDFVSGQTITYIDVPFSVNLTSDPYIRISTPTNNSTVSTNYVEIKYSIANFSVPNDGLVSASLDGGTPVTSKSSSSVALTNLLDGKHTVALTLVDNTLVPIRTAYGSANLSITVAATNARQPLIVALAPNDGSVFAIGTTYVDISYDVTNYTIPDDGGVVIKVGDSETFVKSLLPYKLPVTPGDYNITLTLATSASAKLVNKEATTTIGFTVGAGSGRATRNVKTLSSSVPEISYKAIAEPKEAEESSSSEEESKGFVIVSNGSSAINGQTTIVLSLTPDESIIGMAFRIVGETSIVYFSPHYPIKRGEFDGGTMYIEPSERSNVKTLYGVISNTESYAVLSETIQPPSPDEILNSVAIGQIVRFVKKTNIDDLWVMFDNDWERNILAGGLVAAEHAKGGRSYGFVVSNTSRTMKVYGLDKQQIRPGDSLSLLTPVFSDVKTFTVAKTSINLDHRHTTSLILNWIKGDILNFSLISSSKVLITASHSYGLDAPLIVANPQIARGIKIMFYSQNGQLAFEETIDSVYPTGVIVDVSDTSNWNIDGSKSFGIDSTYEWESDVSLCGVTTSTTYSDFIAYTTALDRDVIIGTINVWVSDISKFSVGDTVELFDSSGTIQRTKISSISDHLIIDDPAQKTFSVKLMASIRTRLDSYPVDHIHEIKNGEVYLVDVEEYRYNGYSLSHNHVLSSPINSVTCVKNDASGTIYVGGTSEEILATTDDGETWNVATNLDNYGEPCSLASCMSLGPDGTLTIGTGCGFVMQQATTVDKNAIPISIQEIEASSSSSSASSSSISSVTPSSQTSNSSDSSSSSES